MDAAVRHRRNPSLRHSALVKSTALLAVMVTRTAVADARFGQALYPIIPKQIAIFRRPRSFSLSASQPQMIDIG
jgi:hypothetical protein